jgi:hypothetical protein
MSLKFRFQEHSIDVIPLVFHMLIDERTSECRTLNEWWITTWLPQNGQLYPVLNNSHYRCAVTRRRKCPSYALYHDISYNCDHESRWQGRSKIAKLDTSAGTELVFGYNSPYWKNDARTVRCAMSLRQGGDSLYHRAFSFEYKWNMCQVRWVHSQSESENTLISGQARLAYILWDISWKHQA